MAKQDFNDLLSFLAVAKEGHFTKAAAKLGISQSTLSHTIKRLETEMGIRLLTRTTRNVGLTEAGERLRQSLAPRIAEIEADIADLMLIITTDTPRGVTSITVIAPRAPRALNAMRPRCERAGSTAAGPA